MPDLLPFQYANELFVIGQVNLNLNIAILITENWKCWTKMIFKKLNLWQIFSILFC